MSDREGAGPSGPSGDDDLSLPKATVYKLIQEMLPDDLSCAKETKDLIVECCVEFIHLISSESNAVCETDSKKTISPEHVIAALKRLDFESYIAECEDVLKEAKAQAKEKVKTTNTNTSGLSQEELAKQQELLFAASKARFEAGQG